jgi:hypothetical protein
MFLLFLINPPYLIYFLANVAINAAHMKVPKMASKLAKF